MNFDKLKLNFCSYQAAKFACENWHYSKCMPAGKTIKIGVWENEKFKGVVIFSRGANNNLLKPYGLKPVEGCELTRVALREHETTVTRIVSIAIKILKKHNPGLKLIVSFADSRQGHLGIIYQAGNWIFTGKLKSTPEYFINGKFRHQRNIHSYGFSLKTSKFPKRDGGYRLRYLMPLTEELKNQVIKKKKNYIKREIDVNSSMSGDQPESAGA